MRERYPRFDELLALQAKVDPKKVRRGGMRFRVLLHLCVHVCVCLCAGGVQGVQGCGSESAARAPDARAQ